MVEQTIEIDNFIVHPEHRSKGLGKMMTDYIDVKAKEEGVIMMLYRKFTAHRFYTTKLRSERLSFCKIINEDGLS
jgi:ribosomal protein S18 acetylase RimI-like enzyme